MTGQPRDPDQNRPAPAEHTAAAEGGGAAVTALRRRGPSSTRRDWTVQEIRTETMTPEQHEAAVDALAVLIEGWHHRPGPDQQTASGGLDRAA